VAHREGLLPLAAGLLFGKERQDWPVHRCDPAFLDRLSHEGGEDALRDRTQVVAQPGVDRLGVGFEDDATVAHDQHAVRVEARRGQIVHQVRQDGRVQAFGGRR